MKPEGRLFDRDWRAACVVERIGRNQGDAMIRRHYIGKWPGVCVLVLGMRRMDGNGEYLGVIVFALPPRETSKRYGGVVWELARLWIDDSVPKNAETWLIGKAVKHIRATCTGVDALVSYANPSVGHCGTIYRAANWVADGRTDDGRKTPRFDYACSDTGKQYSRRGHVPDNVKIVRVARISKHRFVYRLKPTKEPKCPQ